MTTKTPTPKKSRTKLTPGRCVAGNGGYGFPKAAKVCGKPTWRPTARLCQRHEDLWRAARKPRAQATKPATPTTRPSAKARREEYAAIVARLEAEGATTSDAQAAADVEVHERGICDPKTCPLHLAAKAPRSKPPVSAAQ